MSRRYLVAHFLLREARHFVELIGQGIVGTDVKAVGQVVHSNRTNARHEDSLQGGIGSRLDGVEELSEITCAMSFCLIAVETIRLRQDGIGEMVVLIDEEIYIMLQS